MEIFSHFWIDLFTASEDNVEITWLSELEIKMPKRAKISMLRISG
jgi:hypothetical protein